MVLTIALVGCSGNGRADGMLPTAPPTTAPTVTTSVATTTTVLPSTTVAATSTVAPAATTVVAGVGLSPDGPWRLVDSAPGVTTPGLVYELMPKLWAFIQLEETDTSTYPWTLNDADQPIIEAYLQAQLTYYQAATSDPIDFNQPGWTQFYDVGGSGRFEPLKQRRLDGQVADLDVGVVFQPWLLGDERTDTYAIVADCVLDGGVFRMPDGSLAEGSTAGVARVGKAARMEVIDEQWKVVAEGSFDGGCS
ncbi:MAG: hypothetical protein LH616_10540 [Ilumatobacteraceae bacterium]|nr:hypothetical protein [Ilumatobacteraceae bacterium]